MPHLIRIPTPSAEYLRECLDCDLENGLLVWCHRPLYHFSSDHYFRAWNARFAGKRAFCTPDRGYFCGRIDKTPFRTHRIIWKMAYGKDAVEIDHIDGNRSNNSIANLRSVSHADNCRNTALRIDNKSGVAGVHWDISKRRFTVSVGHKFVGRFKTYEEAVERRMNVAKSQGYSDRHGVAS